MKLLFKIGIFSILICLSSTSALANINFQDRTKQFIQGYQQLKNKNLASSRQYILHYELVTDPRTCSIFFDGHGIPKDPRVEASLKEYAADLPQLIKKYEEKGPEIKSIVAEVQERTARLFGHEINANVILSTSVSMTDAVTTGSEEIKYPTVALNMREMSKYSKDELRIVLSHELFHVLQHQIEKDHSISEPIAGNLYSEGWATYASSLVYPGFSDWKYISYFTKDNSQFLRFESNRKAIIHHLLRDWNSRSERHYDKYFSADPTATKPFEPRSGYYIGYMAAKALAEKKKSPVQVALIKYEDFKKEIKPLLKKMSEVS
jgi:hypothetical protein